MSPLHEIYRIEKQKTGTISQPWTILKKLEKVVKTFQH